MGDGWKRALRQEPDEDLHRLRLAVQREEVNAGEALPDLVAAHGAAQGAILLADWVLALAAIRGRIEAEESFRERARARGVSRDAGRGWVPEEVLRAIKERIDLADLIMRWGLTDLRQTRRGVFVGKCPFHKDSDPSFWVYQTNMSDQHWHCYGCNAHGDVITLAERHFDRSYREAVEGLAGVAGVDWPPTESVAAPPLALPSSRRKRGSGAVFPR